MTRSEAYRMCIERCEANNPDTELFSFFAHLLEDYAVLKERNRELEREITKLKVENLD